MMFEAEASALREIASTEIFRVPKVIGVGNIHGDGNSTGCLLALEHIRTPNYYLLTTQICHL